LTNPDKLKLIDKQESRLSISRQTVLLGLPRNKIYYRPETNERDIAIMNIIDAVYTDRPCYGKRRMATVLRRDYGIPVGKNHVRTLMIKMGLIAIYPKKKKNLSEPNRQHKVYPYLLRGLSITRAN